MMSTVETELLTGFLAEAHGYVSSLQNALLNRDGASEQAQLEDMLSQATILSSAAEMLGLDKVTPLTQSVAKALEALVEKGTGLSEADCRKLTATLNQIDEYLIVEPESVQSDDDNRGPLSDLPPELLEIFVLEAKEHSQVIERGLERLRSAPSDLTLMGEMRRVMHTLKGAAASVGFAQMAHLAHLMEEILERTLENDSGELPPQVLELLFDSADVLDNLLNPGQTDGAGTSYEAVDQRYVDLLGAAYPQLEAPSLPEVTGDGTVLQPTPQVEEMLRLSLASMDLLINRVGEIIINRSGLERQLGALRDLLMELEYAARRLRQVAQEIDAQIEITLPDVARKATADDATFDPLELDRYSLLYQLTRELEEVAADTDNINTQLRFLSGDLDAGLTRERRLTSELQDGLLATRLVPFYELETRLRRIVHRTARDLGKEVDLILAGFDTKVDKTILDTLADPLMHLLRNAVDHGIEPPAVRRATNKAAKGTVTLTVLRQRGRIEVTLSDDGAGIDLDQVLHRAVALGMVTPSEHPSEQQLLDLLFHEGFSLSETVTQTSGRGVGLDIVRRAIYRAQGTVRIDNRPGRGVTFTISVPVTLAITQALFIHSGNAGFAVPLEQIAVVLRLESTLIEDMEREGVLRYDGRALAAYNLAEFTQGSNGTRGTPRYGLITERDDQDVIVLVDGMAGIHEAVVKSLGSHLRRVQGVMGATIAGDGSVTLILDLMEIVGLRHAVPQIVQTEHASTLTPTTRATMAPHVLVVDDSVSVRRVVSSFMERMGWQTTEARDGIEALEKLAANRPDVALVDIEMPRMNGYELLARIKADPDLRSVPVVFLTSRSATKHRDRAAQLGVDGYLVKPYNENELLQELMRVTQQVRQAVR